MKIQNLWKQAVQALFVGILITGGTLSAQTAGEVGINTNQTDGALTVKGNGTTNNTKALHAQDANLNSLFVVQDNGKVGVNNANPVEELDIIGDILCSNPFGIGNIFFNNFNTRLKYVLQDGTIELLAQSTPISRIDLESNGTMNLNSTNAHIDLEAPLGINLKATDVSGQDIKMEATGVVNIQAAQAVEIENGSQSRWARFDCVNERLSLRAGSPDATLDIEGEGATSSSHSLLIENSAGTDLFSVQDDGKVGVGTHSPQEELEVVGSIFVADGGDILFGDNIPTSTKIQYFPSSGSLDIEAQGTSTSGMDIVSNAGMDLESNSGDIDLTAFGGMDFKALGSSSADIGIEASRGIDIEAKTGDLDMMASDDIFMRTTDEIRIYDGLGINWMVMECDNRRVGIGTSSPDVELEVVGTIECNVLVQNSDRRFKQDIQPLESALSKVLKLEGVSYNWNQQAFPEKDFNNLRQIGVIAQDIELVFPELVKTNSEGYKSVNYAQLTPILIEAIKEQQELILSQQEAINQFAAFQSEMRAELKEMQAQLKSTSGEDEMVSQANRR